VAVVGSSPIKHDPTLCVHTSPRGWTLLPLYFNGIIITSDDSKYIAFVESRLPEQFIMCDLGPFCYFLRSEVACLSNGFFIFREKVYT
jgi:hypothetical protein